MLTRVLVRRDDPHRQFRSPSAGHDLKDVEMRQPRITQPIANDMAALIGRITALNGRVSEISNRMQQDVLQLVELEREISICLAEIWALPKETPPTSNPLPVPRMLRGVEVIKRVGLARSTVWKLVKEGRFPSPRRLAPRAVGWSAVEIDEWMRTRPTNSAQAERKRGRVRSGHVSES